MENILVMSVMEAHDKCKSSALANQIWKYKHPDQRVLCQDAEYKSWLKSIPYFLDAAVKAGLGNLEVVFELPTPLGGYIDIALLGTSLCNRDLETGRILIVELKQWSSVMPTMDRDYVGIQLGGNHTDLRRHPISQIREYVSHMSKNHRGIYCDGHVHVDALAYLHNF